MNDRTFYWNDRVLGRTGLQVSEVGLATQQETVPETAAQHYGALSATADDCLMYGRCEPNCPFGVKIRKNMKRAREVFHKAELMKSPQQ